MRRRVAWATVTSLALAACGSGGGGGGDDDIDGGSAGDAASPAPDAAPTGPVRLTDSKIFPQRAQSTTITFSLDPEGPGSCLSEIVAGCEVQDCESGEGAVRVAAGTVTLTTPLGEVVHAPETEGYPTTPGIDWEPGDTVSLSVAGSDDVAAFEESVPGPGTITAVTAPNLAAPTDVPRDQPLVFEWEGADAAVTAVVSCNAADGIQQVRCVFPSGVLGHAMPAEALARMPACEGSGNIYLLTERRVLTGPPGLAVRFGVRGPIHAGPANID